MSFNLIAIMLAAVSSMVVGTLWFRPRVFGNRWQALTGVDPNKPKRPGVVYALSFVLALLTATGLSAAASGAQELLGGSAIVVALAVASGLWVAFIAATSAVHYLFEGRSPRIFAINTGHQLVTVLLMAVILGLFGF